MFLFSRPLPGKLTVTQSCKKEHQKQTHVTLTLTQQDHDTYLECTCHLNIYLCTPFQPLEYEYIISLYSKQYIYIYIYPFGVLTLAKALEVLQSTNLLQSTRGAAKHKGCCTAQGLLQSTRGAAKYKGCCKAQGLLQTTRVAAKHKGCCQAQGVLSSTRGACI